MEAKFVRELLKIAIAQIVSLEFEGVQSSCMDVLSDVVIDYILNVGVGANHLTNLASRTDSNYFGISESLRDVGVDLKELMTCDGLKFDPPFAKGAQRYLSLPVPLSLSQEESDDTPRPMHIPTFLPAFPSARTYARTEIINARPAAVRQKRVLEQRQMEEALTKHKQTVDSQRRQASAFAENCTVAQTAPRPPTVDTVNETTYSSSTLENTGRLDADSSSLKRHKCS